MARITQKEKILSEGLKLVHERGYANASVRDIVHAAGVSQGSFTNHFATKEEFGLEVLNLYYSQHQYLMEDTLLNNSLPPLARFKTWVETVVRLFNSDGNWNGCLLGNYSAEICAETQSIRNRIGELFTEIERDLSFCLKQAVIAGELPESTDCDTLAGFIYAALQGSILQAKAERSLVPMERYKTFVLNTLLPKTT
jgi:TetR/AcrR family transcriptional repressor of nem operon